MLRLFERTGLDGLKPSHCRDSFIVTQDVFYSGRTSNRPVHEPRSEGLVKLIGGPLPGPLGHPAALVHKTARRSTGTLNRLLVNKRASRDAGTWLPKSRE